jgi:predicted small lipoprotein YifL
MFSRASILSFAYSLTIVMTTLTLSACGIKGGLYLAPNQLPNARPPAGAESPPPKSSTDSSIAAESLRNPSTDSPAEMLAN